MAAWRLGPALAAAAWLLAACREEAAPPPAASPPIPVQTVTAAETPFRRTLEAIGSLRSAQSTRIATDIAGLVVALDVPEGKVVKKGHVLARLDAASIQAELAVAQARLEGAQDTLKRFRALRGERLASDQDITDAETAKRTAAGEAARARALLDKTIIRAPFEGIVGLRDVSLGAYLSPGDALTTLTDVSTLELVFSVPERYVTDLAVGQTVRGIVGACTHRFAGEVAVVEPAVDPVSRTVRVQARIENESGALRPGMSANVRVEVGAEEPALMIPQEAIVRRGTKSIVYVVEEDGKVAVRDVRPGAHSASRVQIRSGLAPGDVVVAAGHQKLKAGAKVAPAPLEEIENPNLRLGRASAEPDCWF